MCHGRIKLSREKSIGWIYPRIIGNPEPIAQKTTLYHTRSGFLRSFASRSLLHAGADVRRKAVRRRVGSRRTVGGRNRSNDRRCYLKVTGRQYSMT